MNTLNQKDNPVIFWFAKFGDFFCLSVTWLMTCLLVVTIVPASIALYDSVAHCVRGNEEGPVRRYFQTFKNELLKGILINLLWIVIGVALFFGFRVLWVMGLTNSLMATYSLVYLITMLIPFGIFTWMIPVQSRFEHTFGSLHKTAALYCIVHLPSTLMLIILFFSAVVLTLFFPVLGILLPAITVTIQSWFIERAFKQHMPEETVES